MPSIGAQRLVAQHVDGHRVTTPEAVVESLVALQAQDPLAARWAVGSRLSKATDAEVVSALDEGRIVRTHLFRGTWQLLTPADLGWLLPVFGPRVIRSMQGRLRQLELDGKVLVRVEKALDPGALTRVELATCLRDAKVPIEEQRLSYLLTHAELTGLTVSGANRNNQATWVLSRTRVPPARPTEDPRETLVKLARRFVRSRAPVSVRDFAWWAGIPGSEAREASKPWDMCRRRRLAGITRW
jgi:hypothetical protein